MDGWKVGDRVQGGEGEGFDFGVVREVDGRVRVAWTGGVQTWDEGAALRPAPAAYVTVAADDLGEAALGVLETGGPIGDDVLDEILSRGVRVADPAAHLVGRDGWFLDGDGHSHYVGTGYGGGG